MPIHDWTKVDAGIFHDFHLEWIHAIKKSLNFGVLPADYYALAEQITGEFGPDVLTLQRPLSNRDDSDRESASGGSGVALATTPPRVAVHITNPPRWYAARARVVTIRHVTDHRIVAMIEIVSPGNKSSRNAIDAFLRNAREVLSQGVHFLVVDLIPPGPRGPQGLHPLIWDDEGVAEFVFRPESPLACLSYLAGAVPEAFIEPTALGRELTPMPVFLTADEYVLVPLESSYTAAFANVPAVWRSVLDTTLVKG